MLPLVRVPREEDGSVASAKTSVLSLDSVAGSVINNDFLSRADIDPQSALAQDDPESEGSRAYVNLFTTTEELADDETLRQVADLYHEQAVLDATGQTWEVVQAERLDADEEVAE